MSFLAAMFVALFNSYCSLSVIKGFYPALQHCKIAKEKKQASSKLNNCQENFSIVWAKQQRSRILE